jgi:hypothetical protein
VLPSSLPSCDGCIPCSRRRSSSSLGPNNSMRVPGLMLEPGD